MRPWAAITANREIEGAEVVQRRTLDSKTFALGKGRFRLIKSPAPLHYALDGELLEIDLTPRDDGDAWVIDRAPYIARIDKRTGLVTYEGRISGKRARFAHPNLGAPEFDRDRAWWHEGKSNRHAVQIRPGGLVIESWLDAGDADPAWRWVSTGDVVETLTAADAERNPAEMQEKRFTGRVSKMVDPATRRREWRAEPAWPVVIR